MRDLAFRLLLGTLLLAAGCPPTKGASGPGGGGGGGTIDAEACGNISTTDMGRKLYAFLVASEELDKGTIQLEGSVKTACGKMAAELGLATDGDTKTLCNRVVAELRASMEVSVSQETRAVTRTTPPVCTTDIDFTASVVAECEARVQADIDVRCEGRCGGQCQGACDGTCSAKGANGECAGQCSGTCRGSCSANCEGAATVDASAECRASAEVRADVRTTCTEPKVEVVYENVTVIDDARFQRAVRAIELGMPAILVAGKRAEIVAKGVVTWAKALVSLVESGAKVVEEVGDRGLCVVGQITAAFAAMAEIEVRIEVSIQVSADISAAAGVE